ncbi:MAG: alanine racemase [Phycisphaerales bacterium]|nr:alanine racemase [Phycisphaerales bacterium]
MRSRSINVQINLDSIRTAAASIRRKTGVRLIAVIKADAYGLGARRVADALADIADDFAYFNLAEAREVGRPGIVLGPPEGAPADYRELNLRPSIGTIADAQRFAGNAVALAIDVGMQRFGAPPEIIDELLRITAAREAHAHTVTPEGVAALSRAAAGRIAFLHAAASSLLDDPSAWLHAVRPGVALYRGAMRVSTRLHSVRETPGASVGYSGFHAARVGIILAGYCNLLRPAPVMMNGRKQELLEVGMNSSFVSVDSADRIGDEVVLLGGGISECELAGRLNCREHEVLCRYGSMGQRSYVLSGVVAPAAREAVLADA